MKHARSKVETAPGVPGENLASTSEGSNPSPSTNPSGVIPGASVTAKDENITVAVGGLHKTAAIIDCSHLWVLDGQLVIRGMVVTGKECTELPWRRKKDGEPASQAEISRDIELVKALYIKGKVQTPVDFDDTKLFIREDVK